MWHGASWNYILWGLYFALFLLLEKFVIKGRLPGVIAHGYALIVVFFGWVLFRFEDFGEMGFVFGGLLGLSGNGFSSLEVQTLFLQNIFLLIFCAIASTDLGRRIRKALNRRAKRSRAALALYTVTEAVTPPVLLLISIVALAGASYNPFIYFQF